MPLDCRIFRNGALVVGPSFDASILREQCAGHRATMVEILWTRFYNGYFSHLYGSRRAWPVRRCVLSDRWQYVRGPGVEESSLGTLMSCWPGSHRGAKPQDAGDHGVHLGTR